MGVRKNQATLTTEEKSNFVDAVLALKADGTYDSFVQMHVDAMAHATPSNVSSNFRNAAHRGPVFLPWHREYLRRFELELQRIDSSVTLPYWDWTVDNLTTSSIWNSDFMGGNGRVGDNKVMSGPFAHDSGNWPLSIDGPYLRRQFMANTNRLPTDIEVTNCLTITPYDTSPWTGSSNPSFRNTLEGWIGSGMIHNRVHMWVGGSMTLGSSPNDPIFFLHHCNIDRIWAQWQSNHPTGYSPVTGGPLGHNLNDKMFPWDETTPSSVLNHKSLGYTYDTDGIPIWIKNVAGWWADGSVDDNSFVQSIQWLIKEGIMKIPPTSTGSGTGTNSIPSWIKNNASWWSEGKIDDKTFVQGIQWLIQNNIIKL
jgi:tyrosinase